MDVYSYNWNNNKHNNRWSSSEEVFEMSLKHFFKGFKKGMKLFGDGMAILVNSFFLTIVYFVGVGITAFFAKITGKHFLQMKRSRRIESYWEEIPHKKESNDSYYRQF